MSHSNEFLKETDMGSGVDGYIQMGKVYVERRNNILCMFRLDKSHAGKPTNGR